MSDGPTPSGPGADADADAPTIAGQGLATDRTVDAQSDAEAHDRTLPQVGRLPPADAPLFESERYEVVRRLGAGGFGVVYAVRDRQHDGRQLALKLLRHLDPEALYRFKQEFRSLADLRHPSLVRLHDLHADGDRWFLTMELVNGDDFLRHVRGRAAPKPKPTPTDARALQGEAAVARLRAALAGLGEGLAALHDAGKLHRDIKPSNVLVEHDSRRVVLIDFGLVLEGAEGKAGTQQLAGTVEYMAPEQTSGKPMTHAVDCYAVGAMLYEALTGSLPFSGTLLEVVSRKNSEDAHDPREAAPEAPADLADLCCELLSRDAAARPSARDIMARAGAAGREGATPSVRHRRPSELAQTLGGSVAAASANVLVGRDGESARMLGALEQSRQRAVALRLEGPSGIGKSALLAQFLQTAARQHEAVVLAGRCHERESLPFKALDRAVDALCQHLLARDKNTVHELLPRHIGAAAQVFPVLRRVRAVSGWSADAVPPDPQEMRTRAFGALRDLLSRIADRQPLVVAIDDLQWGDVDSSRLLGELLRAPGAPRLLLVVAYHPHERETNAALRALLASFERAAVEQHVMSLGPLAPGAARTMAEQLLEGPLATHAERLASDSDGNPLLLAALADQLLRDGSAARVTAATVEELLAGTLDELDDETRRLLEVCCAAARPLHIDLAARVANISDASAALDALRQRNLVARRADAHIEPLHLAVRRSTLAALPDERRAAVHLRLADAFEASGADIDQQQLVYHFREAGELLRAADAAWRAADEAAEALAFERAAELYDSALELRRESGAALPEGAPDDRELSRRGAEALANAGRAAEAAERFLALAGTPTAQPVRASEGNRALEQGLSMQQRAAEELMRSGRVDLGIAAMRPLASAVGINLDVGPRRALLALLWRRARLRMRGIDFDRRDERDIAPSSLARIDLLSAISASGLGMVDGSLAASVQTQNLLEALRAGDLYRIARALTGEVAYQAAAGNMRRARALLRRASEIAHRSEHPHALGLLAFISGLVAFLDGRFAEAAATCLKAEQDLRAWPGTAWELTNIQLFALQALVYLGDLPQLAERLPALLAEAEERGNLYTITCLHTAPSHIHWLARDEPELAADKVVAALGRWSQRGMSVPHFWGLTARGQIDLYRGAPESARTRLAEAWPSLRASLLLRVPMVRIEAQSLRGRAALACAGRGVGGDRGKLAEEARQAALDMERLHAPWSDALAGLLHAGVAQQTADPDASKLLRSAADRLERAGLALHAHLARYRRALLERDDDARSSAERWLETQGVRRPDRLADVLAPGF